MQQLMKFREKRLYTLALEKSRRVKKTNPEKENQSVKFMINYSNTL